MTTNSTAATLPSVSDVDAALHGTEELRALLAGLGTCIGSMTSVLNAREQSLRSLRDELTAHAAELADRKRAAREQSITAATGA
jgi:hypothetical protein